VHERHLDVADLGEAEGAVLLGDEEVEDA